MKITSKRPPEHIEFSKLKIGDIFYKKHGDLYFIKIKEYHINDNIYNAVLLDGSYPYVLSRFLKDDFVKVYDGELIVK